MSEIWVYMEHPDLDGGPTRVALSSFKALHSKKGFVLVDMVKSAKEEEPKTYTRSEVVQMSKKASKSKSKSK